MTARCRAVAAAVVSLGLALAAPAPAPPALPDDSTLARKLAQYVPVRLTADLSGLSDNTRRMLPLLIEAARAMDEVFWLEASGPRDSVLAAMPSEAARRYAVVNYGPWDRLAGNEPAVAAGATHVRVGTALFGRRAPLLG